MLCGDNRSVRGCKKSIGAYLRMTFPGELVKLSI